MPESGDPKRRFINEKIVKTSKTKKQIVKHILGLLCSAVVFGSIAAISFVYVESQLSEYQEQLIPQPTIEIPKDDDGVETVPTTEIETTAEEIALETSQEPIEDVVQSAMEDYQFGKKDVDAMYNSIRSIAQEASTAIVEVRSLQNETDWFNNSVEMTGTYSGVVIASTRKELIILTPIEAVEHADTIRVTFSDGVEVSGFMKQQDDITGMAIVSVELELLSETTLRTVKTIELGNSYLVDEGDLVIAIGSPAGMVKSIDYGVVSYVDKNVAMVDCIGRNLFSSVYSDEENGTYLVNLNGQLVGWAIKSENNQMSCFRAISEYKGMLEKMTNGLGIPCIGIIGEEFSSKGVYVKEAVVGLPAYNAGIQSGDILTKVGDVTIESLRDYQIAVERLYCEQEVVVTVERKGRDQYVEIQFSIMVVNR